MPVIYLSPSTQENNLYVNGGSEEYYMNLIADAMVPYLRSSGIQYIRNTPEMNAASSLRASNAGNYDLHHAIHSNAAPEGQYGSKRGSIVYYDSRSSNGRRAAEAIANQLRTIYPLSVEVRSTDQIGEVNKTRAPAVLVELAYHDNLEDAQWIQNNIVPIARGMVKGLSDYFGIPFVNPIPIRTATVETSGSRLNLRAKPSASAAIIGAIPNGASVKVTGRTDEWSVVNYNGAIGYVSSEYLRYN